MTVPDEQMHRTRSGDNLLDLLQVHQKGSMTTYSRRESHQVTLDLLHRSAYHVGLNLFVAPLIDLHIVTHSLDVQKVGKTNRDSIVCCAF